MYANAIALFTNNNAKIEDAIYTSTEEDMEVAVIDIGIIIEARVIKANLFVGKIPDKYRKIIDRATNNPPFAIWLAFI
ncbi:hypothetical protein [Clostridium fungisolvens]|uniref:hypothetical protein n=1 Tax=Clostridium fungisolvens TaxID=1604897 RepID=UPI00162162C9|nr:hypothetical protein [Clostridium fungisolvens]